MVRSGDAAHYNSMLPSAQTVADSESQSPAGVTICLELKPALLTMAASQPRESCAHLCSAGRQHDWPGQQVADCPLCV